LIRRDFVHLKAEEISVELVEGGPSVLRAFSEPLRKSAHKQLRELGVTVRTGARVIDMDEAHLTLSCEDGTIKRIPAATVLWAAGVRASELGQSLAVPLDAGGRVVVDESLNVPGYDEVFCVGDMAACTDARGKTVPGVAPAAMQQGRFVARQIERHLCGRNSEKFVYVDKGSLATIGRSRAVAEFSRLKVSGFAAWFLWLAIHLCFLVGFRNRYIVLVQWMWHYFTSRGGAHLITGATEETFRWPDQPRRMGRASLDASEPKPPTSSGSGTTEASGLHRRSA
jgi:NADH dehydrogenase